MNFDANHYVPVLKLKRGEKAALAMLEPETLAHVTPLLEIVEHTDEEKTVEEHVQTAFKGMAGAINRTARYFLDPREIAGLGMEARVFELAADLDHPYTPVTGISRATGVAEAIDSGEEGVAIRVTRQEYEEGALPEGIVEFMGTHGLQHAQTDLLVDLGPVEEMIQQGIARFAQGFLDIIPDPARWRTLTLLASAYPLKALSPNSHAFEDRSEWLAWRNELYAHRQELARLPTFGDCAIQHPRGVEGFDPRYMPISATIRYTLENQWLLIKGVSREVAPLASQYPGLMRQLTSGALAAHFAGSGHCAGCRDMAATAAGVSGPGTTPEAWRRLGTAHHIKRTSQQIQALAWP